MMQPSLESKAVAHIFDQREKLIVLGLTGRTGSGCSTVAHLLSKDFESLTPPRPSFGPDIDDEDRKYAIVYNYAEKHWEPFLHLRVRDCIGSFLLEHTIDECVEFLVAKHSLIPRDAAETVREKLKRAGFDDLRDIFAKVLPSLHDDPTTGVIPLSTIQNDDIPALLFTTLPKFADELEGVLKPYPTAFTRLFQFAANNVRSSGHPYIDTFSPDKFTQIAERCNLMIRLLRLRSKARCKAIRVVIDSLRNPYEIHYFKDRYSAFYPVAVSTREHERLGRLTARFTASQIREIDDQEYPPKISGTQMFVSQHVGKCTEISEIHLYNPNDPTCAHIELKKNLIRYVALMLHPGLVTPSLDERCMQMAFNARANSGCISRQVGAVVTDSNHTIRGVGWNNPPQGQTPCVLRCAEDLIKKQDQNAFSQYELENADYAEKVQSVFAGAIETAKDDGRRMPYCFKDIRNAIDREKNQVHTRSLHAEENAFLQTAKYGGEGLNGGFLFTTASPCELCSKKAYQLGINRILYIDPYPGIAESHILQSGRNAPKLRLFEGAVGRAYEQLFQTRMPYKDELRLITGFEIKVTHRDVERLEQENKEHLERIAELEAQLTQSVTEATGSEGEYAQNVESP